MNFRGVMGWWRFCHQHSWQQHELRKSAWVVGMLVHLLVMLLFALPVLAQQVGVGRVAVVDVEDQNFPVISLFLDVADANGAPVAGLAPANFTAQIEGQAATVQAVTIDSSQPLALLLALDRSTDAVTWAAVQGAAAAVISAMDVDDQVAITTVFEEVQLVQDFTADKNAALSALAGVTPGGQFSAINPAFVDAVNRFNANLPARRAIILVADAPDNISTVSAADVVAQVSGRGAPIYVVGYGERVQNEPSFAQIATATGGQFFAIGAANDLQNSLTALLPQLRQGYRVDLVSTLTVDNLPHTAQVQVNAPNVNGAGSAQFVARTSTIEVTIPGLVAGQPVAGVVDLLAAASLAGTVANVEYRIDGVAIGTAPDLATPVAWDTSTVEAGPHQLTVSVTDNVGNVGEATVELLVAASTPRLDLLGVDHTLFPRVTTFIDAFGSNGLPLVGLNSQSFTVSEDNRPVEPSQIAVSVDAAQPLNLVLVLDRSVTVADWAQVRNAGNTLVDALRPQDQMAIYTFAASPSLVQTVTGNKNTLKSALAAVEAQPPAPATTPPTPSIDNGLNQALLDATNLAATLPAGRRAVVVLTNGTDNTGQIALSSLIEVLQAQTVPVHLLAFGVDGQSAGTLTAIAQLAGGSSVAVNRAVDVRSALQTLILLLQQGYRLDFTSGLQSDDVPHVLTIALAAGGMAAETTGEFIARSRPVTVTFPNVVDGATVSGAMNLTAQAETPAPITSVVYRLNGDILAEVADTSFSIVWNSDTVEPGAYVVEAEVVDAVGNQGRATVGFTVVAPLTVAARLAPNNSDGDIFVGDEVTVEAEVTVFDGTARVEFYVDNELVASDTQSPYVGKFDSTDFGPGNHTITVIARDNAGYEATSVFDFELVALPAPMPQPAPTAASLIPAMPSLPTMPSFNWWRILTWIAIVVIALGAIFMVLSALGSARRSADEQKLMPMRLSLSNLGNVATGYLLRGEDAAGILNFRFSLNGVVLGLPPVARLTSDASAVQPTVSGATGRPVFGSIQLPGLPQGGQGDGEDGEGISVGGMVDKLEEASAVGRIIAEIITSVSMFLPRGLSQPLRMVATQIRRGQMLASRVKRVRRSVDKLNQSEMGKQVVQGTTQVAGQVERVATADTTRGAVAQGARGAGGVLSSTAAAAVAGASRTANKLYDLSGQGRAGGQAGNGATTGVAAQTGPHQWVYVPPVAQGETVTIDVMVGANVRKASGEHQSFRLFSRALGEENAQPMLEEGSIRIPRSSAWPSLLRYVFAGITVLVAVALIWLLAGTLF